MPVELRCRVVFAVEDEEFAYGATCRFLNLAFDRSTDLRRSRHRAFQFGCGRKRIQNHPRDVVVDFGGPPNIDRVPHNEFKTGSISKLQA